MMQSKIMELSGNCSSFLLFGLLLIPGKKTQYFQCYDTGYILILLFVYSEVDTWKKLSALSQKMCNKYIFRLDST